MHDTIVWVVVALLGASIGSFLNVVIYRLPAGKSLLWPPSACPRCGHRLGWGENIPVLGWLLLGGRCRHCQTKISPRYPLVEAFTAAIFVYTYARFGLTGWTIGYGLFLTWMIALAAIDLDTMILPNGLTSSAVVLGLVFHGVMAYLEGGTLAGVGEALIQSIGGMVLGIWLYDAIQFFGSLLLGQTAQGGGDAKLMAAIGAWLGWQGVLITGALASFAGSLLMGAALALGLFGAGQKFPLGPFLAASGAVALFAGPNLIQIYQATMVSMDRTTNLVLTVVMAIVLVLYLFYVRRARAQRN